MSPLAQSLPAVLGFCLRYRKWLLVKAVAKVVLAAAIMKGWW
jgi:hypothetical protein